MAVKAPSERIGTWIQNKWYVERLIGKGATAAVFAARHKIGRRVAVKVLHAEHLANAELCERFQREALAVNRFEHPAAVPATDVDVTEDGAPFIVMELVEGVTLAERMRSGPVPLAEVVTLAIELLDVLAAAHERKIVHRDVKPENLLIQADGRLRVLDFGVAKFEGSVLTEKGESIGTAPYMAPEQVRGDDIDARVDVFAVGATMFHAIAGRPIHLGASAGEVLLQAATASPPPLGSVASVPEELGMVVDCALSFDPIDRYKDARAMQVELRALASGLKTRGASAPPPRIERDEGEAVAEDTMPTMITRPGSKKT